MAARAGISERCNICEAPLQTRFEAVVDPQTRETFAILECPQCGLGHTSPQPEDLGPYYGAEYHGGRHGLTTRYCTWRRQRFLGSQPASTNRQLLDVGCGDGSFLQAAQASGWTTFGTEMNPALARERGLTVFESLAEAAALAPFGCITLWHSLEHFRDPKAMLTQAASLLAPDGTLLVAVPDWGGVQARAFGPHWFHLDVPRHLHHFTTQSLTVLAKSCGLVIGESWHTEAELDLFGWTQSAMNFALTEPNVLFSIVAGKPTHLSQGAKWVQLGLGAVATLAALPAFSTAVALRRGGIVVLAMHPANG